MGITLGLGKEFNGSRPVQKLIAIKLLGIYIAK
jgi:hypothetical protein